MKVPYKRESNIFTINGPLMEFNGVTLENVSELCARRYSSDNKMHGIVRLLVGEAVYTCSPIWKYFLNGKEYPESDLFI